jgi:hypothetical protein
MRRRIRQALRVGGRFLLEVENSKPTARLDKMLALMKTEAEVLFLLTSLRRYGGVMTPPGDVAAGRNRNLEIATM